MKKLMLAFLAVTATCGPAAFASAREEARLEPRERPVDRADEAVPVLDVDVGLPLRDPAAAPRRWHREREERHRIGEVEVQHVGPESLDRAVQGEGIARRQRQEQRLPERARVVHRELARRRHPVAARIRIREHRGREARARLRMRERVHESFHPAGRAGRELRDVQDAEARVEQVGLDYEAAKQTEIAQLAAADGKVREAQAALNKLTAGPTTEDVAAAQAGVDQAQAKLDALKAGPRAEDLAAAQAGVDQAAAALADLRAGGTPSAVTAARGGRLPSER